MFICYSGAVVDKDLPDNRLWAGSGKVSSYTPAYNESYNAFAFIFTLATNQAKSQGYYLTYVLLTR